MANPRFDSDVYWATLPPDDCAQAVWDIVELYRKHWKGTVLYERCKAGFRIVHGLTDPAAGETSRLNRRGTKGHRASLKSAVAAVDARHQMSLIAPMIPALDAIPVNTAYKTLAQVREGKRFFDYYVERKGLGKVFYQCAEYMRQFTIGWIVTDWDVFAGPLLQQPGADGSALSSSSGPTPAAGPPQQQGDPGSPLNPGQQQNATAAPVAGAMTPAGPFRPRHAGELRFKAYNLIDCIVDLTQDGHHDWFVCRDKVSKYKLIKDYPDLEADILQSKTASQDDEWTSGDFRYDGPVKDMHTDLIPIFTLHHRRSTSLEQGRMLRILEGGQTWLFDGPYPYDELKLSEMSAGKVWNVAFGDSTLHHAGGLQQALDRTLSAVVTNTLTLGHQLVWLPTEEFELVELSDGVSALTGNATPGTEPKSISLLAPQDAALEVGDNLKDMIHATLGVNSVIRGEPDENIKTGIQQSQLIAQAAQYNSPEQYSFTRCVEDVGNHMLEILKKFADQPILGEISGPNGSWRLKEFKQEDFAGIHRLVAKHGNPAEQTAAFKEAKADKLLEAGLLQTPEQYNEITEMHSDEAAIEDKEAVELCVLLENETMQAYADNKPLEPVMVLVPPPPPQPPPGAPPGLPPPPPLPLPDGRPVLCPPVLMTDDDAYHIAKCKALLDTPGARGNQNLVAIVGAHIAWHMESATSKPPELLALLGQMPVPMTMGLPPGQEGPPGKDGKPPPKKNGATKPQTAGAGA